MKDLEKLLNEELEKQEMVELSLEEFFEKHIKENKEERKWK